MISLLVKIYIFTNACSQRIINVGKRLIIASKKVELNKGTLSVVIYIWYYLDKLVKKLKYQHCL